MKFRNINLLNHFMINDQYKLDIVDRLVNCKTIKCNYVHYFMITRILYTSLMIISNYLFFDQTISCIKNSNIHKFVTSVIKMINFITTMYYKREGLKPGQVFFSSYVL